MVYVSPPLTINPSPKEYIMQVKTQVQAGRLDDGQPLVESP